MRLPRWLGGGPKEHVAPIPALRSQRPNLPAWAQIRKDGVIEVDTDAAYGEWFQLLGNPKLDQYWLEVAYQCAKMDLQAAIAGTPMDPSIAKQPALFKFRRSVSLAQSKHKRGKGPELATKGLEARAHYRRIRGFLPF